MYELYVLYVQVCVLCGVCVLYAYIYICQCSNTYLYIYIYTYTYIEHYAEIFRWYQVLGQDTEVSIQEVQREVPINEDFSKYGKYLVELVELV